MSLGRQCRFQFCWVCLAPYSGQGGIFQTGNSAHARTCRHFREIGEVMPVVGLPPVHLSDTEDDADDDSDFEFDWPDAMRTLQGDTGIAAHIAAVAVADPEISESDDGTAPPSPNVLPNRSRRAASIVSISSDELTDMFDSDIEEHDPIPVSDDERPITIPRPSQNSPLLLANPDDGSDDEFIIPTLATKRKTIGSHSVGRSKRAATSTPARTSAAPEVIAARKSLNKLQESSARRHLGARAVFVRR